MFMKKRPFLYTFLFFVVGLLIQSCNMGDRGSGPEFPLEQADVISEENYNIYSLVIEEKYSSEKIVIVQATKKNIGLSYGSQYYEYLIENYPEFDTTLVKAHEELNKDSVHFGKYFHFESKEIILITSEKLSNIFDRQDLDADWEEFYNDYENANGIIWLSRIAFNEDKTQAVFEIDYSYGSLGGGGNFIWLRKENGSWTIINSLLTWIS